MKNFINTLILAVAVSILAFPISQSFAADPVSIGVVDVQKLVASSKAGKNIQQQLEKQKSAFLSEISKQEQKLRDDEKELSSKRSSMSQEDFAKKAKEFEANLAETRRKAQDRKKDLEEAANKALLKLREEINKVVSGIADEKKFDLVLNSQNVIVSNKSYDVTEEALAKLDKSISQIPLDTGHN